MITLEFHYLCQECKVVRMQDRCWNRRKRATPESPRTNTCARLHTQQQNAESWESKTRVRVRVHKLRLLKFCTEEEWLRNRVWERHRFNNQSLSQKPKTNSGRKSEEPSSRAATFYSQEADQTPSSEATEYHLEKSSWLLLGKGQLKGISKTTTRLHH